MSSYAKLSARAALTGNYTDPAATVVLMLIIVLSVVFLNQLVFFYALRYFKAVFTVSAFVLLFFLCISKYSLSARLLRVCERNAKNEKSSIKRTVKGGLLELCLFFLKLLNWIVFLMPPAFLAASVYLRVRASTVSVASLAVNIAGIAVLLLMSLVFSGVSIQKYSKAVYYFAGNPHISVVDAIRMSADSTRGIQMRIFRFKLSFLPWMLSGILLLPLMFVLPYCEESFIFYCMYSRK